MTNNFVFEPNLAAKTIHVIREFDAPVENVWKAFTDPGLLVKWIAPKPWTAEIKTWDFIIGGISLYAMISPDGRKQWVYAQFSEIEHGRAFSTTGMYCDGDGNPVTGGPKSYHLNRFSSIKGDRSEVDTLITFEDESTIKWFVEGGFKEGTELTFAVLDELLASE